MGKEFFNSWELWQKMTFVLACGIVLTIFVGLIKVQFNNWRIRKYSKVEKGKQAQTPEMLESQPVQPTASNETKEDVPFGIRAIESGIEVDGVWISRTNTPVGSSRSSITDVKLPRSHNSSQLELPKAAYGSSSRDSSLAPSSAFDRAVSAERITSNDSRSSSPNRDNANSSRGHLPIASSSRQHLPPVARNSWTLQALEGYEAGLSSSSARYETNNSKASSSSNKSSGRTSDESDYMNLHDSRPYEAAYINPRNTSLAVPIDPKTDLNLLQSHRLSHVAETGQLTPRARRPGNSGEWASVADNMRSPYEISTSNGVDYFVPQQKTPSPPLPVVSPAEELPAPSTSRYTQDGHSYNQARQAVPLLETYAPQANYMPESYQPSGPHHQYEDEPQHYAEPSQQYRYPRDNNVVRKVNSGFEILRPGTFGEPPSPEEEKPGNGEKRQSKRLQKKRRSSSGSNTRTSHFVEQV